MTPDNLSNDTSLTSDEAAGEGSAEMSASATDTIVGAGQAQPPQGRQQVQLRIDDSAATVQYASTVRVWGSGEELNLDFAAAPRPSGQNQATLKIEHRVTLSPWAAKRLALALSQSVARYEQAYGTLELDERRRRKG